MEWFLMCKLNCKIMGNGIPAKYAVDIHSLPQTKHRHTPSQYQYRVARVLYSRIKEYNYTITIIPCHLKKENACIYIIEFKICIYQNNTFVCRNGTSKHVYSIPSETRKCQNLVKLAYQVLARNVRGDRNVRGWYYEYILFTWYIEIIFVGST